MHVCTGLDALWPGDWDGTVRVIHTHGDWVGPNHVLHGGYSNRHHLHRRVRCIDHAWPGWERGVFEPHPYHPDFQLPGDRR